MNPSGKNCPVFSESPDETGEKGSILSCSVANVRADLTARLYPVVRLFLVAAAWTAFFVSPLFCAEPQSLGLGPNALTVESRSKQFVVMGQRSGERIGIQNGRIQLDPSLLAVSCDRIRESLYHELGFADRNRPAWLEIPPGKIYLVIHPTRSEGIELLQVQGVRSISYRIDLPRSVSPEQLLEVVVKALLLEVASRHATGSVAAELPGWMVEGLIALLKSNSLKAFGLQPNTPIQMEILLEPNAFVRQQLQNFQALTFEELSWPQNLIPARSKIFEACAQLLVFKLLQLPEGKKQMGRMLVTIPHFWNWQFAFLKAFESHFDNTAAVEKWWALQVISFTGRDPSQLWSSQESFEKIAALFRIPVDIHMMAQKMPARKDVGLDEVIVSWNVIRQTPVLENIAFQLRSMRVRVANEYLPICDEMRVVLENFLLQRESLSNTRKGAAQTNPKVLRQTAVKKLQAVSDQLQKIQTAENKG